MDEALMEFFELWKEGDLETAIVSTEVGVIQDKKVVKILAQMQELIEQLEESKDEYSEDFEEWERNENDKRLS